MHSRQLSAVFKHLLQVESHGSQVALLSESMILKKPSLHTQVVPIIMNSLDSSHVRQLVEVVSQVKHSGAQAGHMGLPSSKKPSKQAHPVSLSERVPSFATQVSQVKALMQSVQPAGQATHCLSDL